MSLNQQTLSERKILIVDDDHDFRWAISNVLGADGYSVFQAQDGEEALKSLEKYAFDLILLDYRMPGKNGITIAGEIKKRIPTLPIVIITAYAEVKSAVEAIKMGVYDYLTKPVDNNDLIFTIKRALEKQDLSQEVERLRKVLSERTSLYEFMGNSDQIKNLFHLVKKVAPTSFTVLIEGESGTGKELVAHAIHNMSEVKEGPFVAVDCGAIPETLIESELFGYMKGAFTGAYTDKPGQFELAEGGTLFLDEVGNLPYPAQQKLLRAMQERYVQRLGAKKAQPIQVRMIAATNKPLEKDVKAGKFRSDLYYRLNEFVISVPPLRERKDDLPYLAKKFIDEVGKDLKKRSAGISRDALSALVSYHWPGNVRELRNVIRQAVLLCDENIPIKTEHLMLSNHLTPVAAEAYPSVFVNADGGEKTLREMLKFTTDAFEKRVIEGVLKETKGNKSKAARKLGIDYKTLLRKIKIHQIIYSDH